MNAAGGLLDAVGDLVELWPRLVTATGGRGIGQPSHKSRPPASLTVVTLVMDVTIASREGAQELARRIWPDTRDNLRAVAGVLTRVPDQDMIDWWTGAIIDWTGRARTVLGYQPELPRWVHGAQCPFCRATVAHSQQDGEAWVVPAIGVQWVEHSPEQWEVQAVHCRACGAQWTREINLHLLVEMALTQQWQDTIAQQQ